MDLLTVATETPAGCARCCALRDLQRIADGAKADLREGLGPEFSGFDLEDLNPKRFVHKHLFDDLNADQTAQQQPARQAAANGTPLAPGERPPFDPGRDVSREFSIKQNGDNAWAT
jgi:sec-independent protein translocase protein TatB